MAKGRRAESNVLSGTKWSRRILTLGNKASLMAKGRRAESNVLSAVKRSRRILMELSQKSGLEAEKNDFAVYIVRTENGQLYVGQTDNGFRREFEHKFHAHGAKFLKDCKAGFNVVYQEHFKTRSESMHRERQLKGWTRAKKEALIVGDTDLLKKL